MSQPPATASPTETELADLIEREVANSPVPGLAVAITHNDDVVHLGGYGEAAPGVAMTTDTPSMVGSLSKSFTAVAVLRLVEDGSVDLDAPVQHYIEEFTTADSEHSSQVTVRNLLEQTSGLADRGFPQLWDLDRATAAERVAVLASATPVDAPGGAHHSFNPNYAVLARLVEVIAGQPFDEYLHEHVLAPLDMGATSA